MTHAHTPTSETHTPTASLVKVKMIENGPYQVKGPVELVDHDGNVYDIGAKRTVFLCRCGGSTTKPFCDGTHSKIGFGAAERAVDDADRTEH